MRRRNVAYIRVAEENDLAVSIQKQAIDNYAIKHNLVIDYYYIDNGYSGRNFNRPQLRQLLRDVKNKKITDRIIIQDCSKLCRNFNDIGIILKKISKRSVKLVSIIEEENSLFDLQITLHQMFRKEVLHKRMMVTKFEQEKKGCCESL